MKASVPQTSSIRVAALIRETPDGDRQTDRQTRDVGIYRANKRMFGGESSVIDGPASHSDDG